MLNATGLNHRPPESARAGTHPRPSALLALAVAAGMLLPAPERAVAQQVQAAAYGQLEEVIVHARRRSERLEEAPLAVTVRSAAQLQQQTALVLGDVGRAVPNVRMVSSPQSVSALDVTMRGQTVNRSAIVFDPAVGLYVDGVYVANGQASMATLLDIEDVELVRGSQGTLFGRNNTGGSIALRTHRPEFDAYAAEVAGSTGSRSEFMGRALANLPLSEDLALRLAYQNNERRGWGTSVASGQDGFLNQHRYQLRLGALWTPTDSTEAYLTYERFEAKEVGALLHPLAGPAPGTLIAQLGGALSQFPLPGLPAVAFPTDPYQTGGSFAAFDRAQSDAVHLTVTQSFSDLLEGKLIAGYRHLEASTALDVDASALPLADSTLYNTSNQKSVELQLAGHSQDRRLDWVGGLYTFRDNGSAPSVQAAAAPDFLTAITTVAQLTGGQLDLTPYFSPLAALEQNSALNISNAAFVHTDYQLTRDWAVAAGVRRTEDRRELQENSYVLIPGVGQNCTILDATLAPPFRISGPCPAVHDSISYGFWSGELSSRYRLSEALHAYLRIGRSQRSGGWNAPLATLQDAPFRPEQLTDYELGLKARLFGGALLVNAAAFYGNYDDMQRLLARLNPDGTPATLVTNAGRARVSGAELEWQWHASAQLALQGSFGWTDARYLEFAYSPGLGVPAEDLAANHFYQTPRYQAALAGTWEIPTRLGLVRLRADYAWQDRIEFNVINDFNYQGAYGTLNARMSLVGTAQRWELALYGSNLADQAYAYTGGTLSGYGAGPGGLPVRTPTIAWQIPGERRVWGVEGTYRWNGAR